MDKNSVNKNVSALYSESSEWELKIANLVGFEEHKPIIEIPDLEDDISLDSTVFTAKETEIQQPHSSNIFVKLSLVGTAILATVTLSSIYFFLLANNSSQSASSNIGLNRRSQLNNTSNSQDLEAEIETLKTKLSLTEQAQEIESTQQKSQNQKSKSPQIISTPNLTISDNYQKLQTRPPSRHKVSHLRIAIIKTLPQSLPTTTVKPNTQPSVNLTPSPTPDPITEWMRLAKLGSYGQVDFPIKNTQVVQAIPNYQSQQSQSPATAIVNQRQLSKPKFVAVGTSAKAVLATAVFGETTQAKINKNQDSNKNLFVVQLKEPLKSVDGEIALPANTQLLTEISSISQQGLLKLDIVNVILENNHTLIQKSLPRNAVIIRAPHGKPLIANRFSNQASAITGIDVGQFVLGAAGKAGELSNRADSQITIVRNDTQYTSDNSRGNILAGLLEGGISNVSPQISQRNQQAISQINRQRSNIWFLQAGKEVEIYVNQLMQF
ncbi:TrbI/VirB10 family protein [Nostoc sp. FACHB-110]|uniref:TrbI/VirB10 family protein n=1 Tax=Nostoc sp. FACHB-110 TaxID=2692834 RepID=UPI0016847311|nr:TrbI/VirB10 family protein [Nostoc sp. FACHB-110]MBD2435900.1 hypothetical protein [Nostoc sp. FACHB-110]